MKIYRATSSLSFRLATSLLLLLSSGWAISWDETIHERWDLSEVYADIDAWKQARDEVKSRLTELETCSSKKFRKASELADCLEMISQNTQNILWVYSYANLGKDAGGSTESVGAYSDLLAESSALFAEVSRAQAALEPNIVATGTKKVRKFLRSEERLEPFSFFLEDILRRSEAGSILEADQEKVAAIFEDSLGNFQSTYTDFFTKETAWPSVVSPSGGEVILNSQGYVRARAWKDRNLRRLAFAKFYGHMDSYKATLGGMLSGAIKANVARARVHNFDTALQARLDSDHLPQDVYDTLISVTRETIDTLHRYFDFRKRLMGLPTLAYYDIYPSLVEGQDLVYPLSDAKRMMVESLEALGPTYIGLLKEGLNGRWMDVYPRERKESGAYMNGSVYGLHPFILLNYQERYDDVSTLVHEWGHALHTLLATEAQPFEKADYPTFIAEIASITPETLMIDKLIAEARNPQERLFYLTEAMEQIRGTFYRQTMFTEFERDAYAVVERGEPATGRTFSKLYNDIVRYYHGADEGVVEVPDYIAMEWAYIPHFYYNFYTFQYATSMAAGLYLAENVKSGDSGGAEPFLNVLRAGGSDYPYEILKNAGVDMSDPDTYRAVPRRMEYLLYEANKALAELEGRQ